MQRRSLTVGALALFASALAQANSGSLPAAPNPPIKRTGAAVDGGLNCTACHQAAPANSDTRGKLTVLAVHYTPGQKQNIKVRLEHPEALRWGFQLTARLASDESRMAGSFTETESVLVRCDDGSLRGAPGPCNGRLEFASHTLASTRAGTRNGVEWDVEWTPPGPGAGEVVLYAAGNAANNGATNAGDFVYTTSLRIQADEGCNLPAAPTIRGVVNGASFAPGIGMNAMISLGGAGFAAAGARRAASGGDLREGRFPTELACIAVEIAGRRAPITYVQEDQINAQAPTIVDRGPVSVRVIANPGRPNERASSTTVQMAEYSPAFFLYPGTNSIAARFPSGQPVAQPNAAGLGGAPARPGDVITLYGTGFGATEPVFQAGELAALAARLRDSFSVTIGGVTLAPGDVSYAGLSPGSISGLYQFNVRVPPSTPDGDVPVVIRIGGVQTQSGATIPVRRQ